MKTNYLITCLIAFILLTASNSLFGQTEITPLSFPVQLPQNLKLIENNPHRYLMTAEYFNKDIFGNFQNKLKVSGIYTRGMKNNTVKWNDVFISSSSQKDGEYQEGAKQSYMENITYSSKDNVLDESFFKNFDKNPQNICARNLIWDMLAIEGFAWEYFDGLKLNKTITVTFDKPIFDIAEVGQYNHSKIELRWIGLSKINNKLCAIIEYKALDNKLKLDTENMKSKGSELYWGNTWVSLDDKQIEYAEMYSGTTMEILVEGMSKKMLTHVNRTILLEKLK